MIRMKWLSVQKTKKARLSVLTVVPWMQKRRWTICGEKGFNWPSAAFTSILANPKLIKPLFDRYKSMHTSSPTKYFVSEGVRGEYWAWKAAEKDPVGSVEMNMAYRAVLRALGVKEVFYEVDAGNKKVLAYHKLHKDVIIETINLPDGRERYLMKSDLTRKNTK